MNIIVFIFFCRNGNGILDLHFRKMYLICNLGWIKTGSNRINCKTIHIQISVYMRDNESRSNVFGNVGGIYK